MPRGAPWSLQAPHASRSRLAQQLCKIHRWRRRRRKHGPAMIVVDTMRAQFELHYAMLCNRPVDAAFKCIGRTRTAGRGERQARQVDITATCTKPASHELLDAYEAVYKLHAPRCHVYLLASPFNMDIQDQMLAMYCTMLDACQEDGLACDKRTDRFGRSSSLQRSFQLQRAGSGRLSGSGPATFEEPMQIALRRVPDPDKPGAVRLHRAAPAVELRSLMQIRSRSPIDVLLSRAHNEAVPATPATDHWTAGHELCRFARALVAIGRRFNQSTRFHTSVTRHSHVLTVGVAVESPLCMSVRATSSGL